MAKQTKHLMIPRTGKDMKKQTVLHCWWECKILEPLWQFLVELNIHSPYDPAIPLLVLPTRNENLHL